jgi:hypothetical protein
VTTLTVSYYAGRIHGGIRGVKRVVRDDRGRPINVAFARPQGWIPARPMRLPTGRTAHAYDSIFRGDAYDLTRDEALEYLRSIGAEPDAVDELPATQPRDR